jgi:hypothetical protein
MRHKTYESAKDAGIQSLKPAPAVKWCPTIIRLDGQNVVLDSGKCVWRQPGHAKAALRNHLYYRMHGDFDVTGSHLWVSQFMDEMQACGRLQFVPFDAPATETGGNS